MGPFWQVLIGELVGILIMVIAAWLCSNAGSMTTISSIVLGSIIIVGFIAMFLVGEQGLLFSNNILKNILVVTFYEQIICVVSFLLAFIIAGISSSEMNERDVLLLMALIIFIVSGLFGEEVFYKEILNTMAAIGGI